MPLPYIDTPRTEVDGNATYLTTGLRSATRANLSALDSVENSLQIPSKDDDILKTLEKRRRSSGGFILGTPRAGSGPGSVRNALDGRRNVAPPKGEFTPMMRSVTRNNYTRNMSAARGTGVPRTPAFLKEGYHGNTPGLPLMDLTDINEKSITGSIEDEQATPVPQVASSSAQSTPLPILPRRDGSGGILSDGQNMMSLKEQERLLDKLEKENFGLKIKIHYLQERLDRAGPEYNKEALKENTELKVANLTMKKDISRYKKSFQEAERELAACRLQLQETREKTKRRQIDETVQREMEWMREEIETRVTQVKDLQEQLKTAKEKGSEEGERLREEVEELEATVRERDRIIEDREEEIDQLKENDGRESGAVAELEEELNRAKDQLEELQDSLAQAKETAQEASDAQEQAKQDKEQAEEDLKELQDEMSNKSFYTKGLSRQLEEKASKLEEELIELRKAHNELKESSEAKKRDEIHLREQLQQLQQDFAFEKGKLQDDIDLTRHERDIAQRKCDDIRNRLEQALDDLNRKADEKELLQTRHHALTDESAGLQKDLAKAEASIRELEQAVEDEKQRALDKKHVLRAQHREEIERLQEEIDTLQLKVEDKEGQFAIEQDKWESSKRTLRSQKERAEEQAEGYRRTIEKLQDVELTLTGKETKLQDVVNSEKERHRQEEALLTRQVKELNDDITSKREIIEEQRNELLSVKEELRISRREEETLRRKVHALEDELVVLQTSLEEEQEYARDQLKKGTTDLENQLHKLMNDKQTLRSQQAHADNELHSLRASLAEAESQRDELQSQLDRIQNQVDDHRGVDQEKIELRKSKLRVESELQRLREERTSLVEVKESLEKELNSEVERATKDENRLSAQIAQLQDKLIAASSGKDREVNSARNKSQRLEKRVHELETLLDQQQPFDNDASTAAADVSVLRHSLDEARRKEKTLMQREADQKASIRALKTRTAELESELHEVQMRKFELNSPRSSPSDKHQEEIRSLRSKLSDAHKALSETKAKNRNLQREATREEDRKDIHELLKSSTLEAESLALKLSERDAFVTELRAQLRRLREQRASALKKADAIMQELEALQDRYDQAMDDMMTKTERKGRHDKEIRGLGREIIWLRARLKREERFRRDLAWSKGLMELGEQVRSACNEVDLRMIAKMGVEHPEREKFHDARRKFRIAILTVIASVRMQRMKEQWGKAQKLSEGLRRAKGEVLKRRETQRRAGPA
ncbi:hypothetical protein V8E54_012120 [Elaphomyces granulatus]